MSKRTRRGAFSTSNPRVALNPSRSAPVEDLRLTEDRRFWSPPTSSLSQDLAWAPARRLGGSVARLALPARRSPPSKPSRRVLWPSAAIGFEAPRSVVICIRRKIRREVIHARGIAGSRVRPGRRGPYSSISCRR